MAGKLKASPPLLPPQWVELPPEMTVNILERLDVEEKLVAGQVCTTWRCLSKDPSLWRKIHISRDSSRRVDFEMMCRLAVDRSQGQLQDLSISGFGSGQLLNHITQRSNGLRHLSIEKCDDITGDSVFDATKGLPLLEELRFEYTSNNPTLEGLVKHPLPALKSLAVNWTFRGNWEDYLNNDNQDFLILMCFVHNLRFVGKSVCYRYLEPIFRAHSHLKSLNLELGFNIRITGAMAEKLSPVIYSLSRIGSPYDDGFHSEYKMHRCDSNRVRISLIYIV